MMILHWKHELKGTERERERVCVCVCMGMCCLFVIFYYFVFCVMLLAFFFLLRDCAILFYPNYFGVICSSFIAVDCVDFGLERAEKFYMEKIFMKRLVSYLPHRYGDVGFILPA